MTFAGALAGDRPVSLAAFYSLLRFGQGLPGVQLACTRQLAAADLQQLRQAVQQAMWVEYYVQDDLPLRMYVGIRAERGGKNNNNHNNTDQGGFYNQRNLLPSQQGEWCDDDNDDNNNNDDRLYLLPHAHFIFGHFGPDRLTSAWLVTDVRFCLA